MSDPSDPYNQAAFGRLWCSLCLFLPVRQRPEHWQHLPLTIMNGQLVCDAHTGYVQGGAHSQALKALQESLGMSDEAEPIRQGSQYQLVRVTYAWQTPSGPVRMSYTVEGDQKAETESLPQTLVGSAQVAEKVKWDGWLCDDIHAHTCSQAGQAPQSIKRELVSEVDDADFDGGVEEDYRTAWVVFDDDWREPPGQVIKTFWSEAEATGYVRGPGDGCGYSVIRVDLPARTT